MNTGRKYCKICVSPYRGEIESLKKSRVSMTDIGRKYHNLFNTNEVNFYQTLHTHFKKKHPPYIQRDVTPIEERQHIDFNEYADKLLQAGAQNLTDSPSKVSHSHVIAAKRTQIEEAKANNQIDATKLMMLKFFRGKPEVIEGETVDDESTGRKTLPTNTD